MRFQFAPPVVVLAVVLSASACGVSEETDRENVRAAVTTVLTAAARDDLRTALPSLAPWASAGSHSQVVPKPWDQLSKKEQDETTAGMWNLVKVIPKESMLRDGASIGAAIAAGKMEINRRVRQANVTISCPPADGKRTPLTFAIRLTLGNDEAWRVAHVEAKFGR